MLCVLPPPGEGSPSREGLAGGEVPQSGVSRQFGSQPSRWVGVGLTVEDEVLHRVEAEGLALHDPGGRPGSEMVD